MSVRLPFSKKAEAILKQLGIPNGLVLDRGLCEYQEAEVLEIAETDRAGRQHLLVPGAAEAWRHLKASALDAGVTLYIVSAFRSVERQAEIIRRKFASGQSASEVLAVSAPPCFSEHHTGRAVDIGTMGYPTLEVGFEDSAAFQWLRQYADRFGFNMSYPKGNPSGYQYEPWHWCFSINQPEKSLEKRPAG